MARWYLPLILVLAACSARPGPKVLTPVEQPLPPGAQSVGVLVATTRAPLADNPVAFGSDRALRPTLIDYTISVPPDHHPGEIEWPGPQSDPAETFTLRSRRDLTPQGFARRIAGERIGLYIHGYNTSYQEALFRTAQLSADSQLEGVPVLFTWPSEARLGAYLADRDASDYSRTALANLLALVTRNRTVGDPVPVLAHSMGTRMTMEALRQLKLTGRDDVLARIELVLAAPDIDLDLFREQMAVIGTLRHPVTVLVSSDDPALKISSRLSAGRTRLGLADVRDPYIQSLAVETGIRIVDITQLQTDDPAHSRYVGLLSSGTEAVRQAGAFIFGQVGGALQDIGGALSN